LPPEVRSFGACTADLQQIADWLAERGIKTVAMESTGVNWIPLFKPLESRGFEVYLLDQRQSRRASGRPKSDVLDCKWLQRLHSCGLLSASFRPSEQVVALRAYLRQRQMLLRYAVSTSNTCRGVGAGERQVGRGGFGHHRRHRDGDHQGHPGGPTDPNTPAELCDVLCKRTRAEVARALEGNWRVESLFALKQAAELYEFYHRKVRECDAEIDAHPRAFADRTGGQLLPPPAKRRGRTHGSNIPPFTDARETLNRMSGVDLTVLEGVNENTALVLLSEVGPDVSSSPRPSTSPVGRACHHFIARRWARSRSAGSDIEATV
jgi:transposase